MDQATRDTEEPGRHKETWWKRMWMVDGVFLGDQLVALRTTTVKPEVTLRREKCSSFVFSIAILIRPLPQVYDCVHVPSVSMRVLSPLC